MSKLQWIKIGKGALIAMGGALIVYIPQAVEMIEWGQYAVFAGAIAAIIVNALRVALNKVSEPELVGFTVEEQ